MKTEWMGSDKRAIAILRVSSHRQKDNTSHDTQEREIRDYCASQGLSLVEIAPITESAKDSEMRFQYHRAIETALKNNIRHVVFNVFDRETRNLTDNEQNEKLVRQNRLVIHYARERKVLHRNSPDSDFFMRDISAATNKHFLRNLSGKVMDAMRTKAEEGWYPGNRPPIGYINERKRDSEGRELKRGTTVIVDPKTKGLVLKLFELRAAGLSFDAIRTSVVEAGLIEPHRIKNFHRSHIEKILKNSFYAGRFIWQGEEFDGKHEVFIPRDLLIKVQGIKRGSRASLPLNEFNLFGYGWMTCAECGCQVVYELKKGRYHYYRCSNSRKAHASLAGMNISLESVWEQMAASVRSITLTPSFAKKLAKAINEVDTGSSTAMKHKIKSAKAALAACDLKEDRAYDHFSAGVLDQLSYQRQIKRIREERAIIDQEMKQAEALLGANFKESAESLIELAIDAQNLWLTRPALERKAFLDLVQSNRRLNRVSIEVELKKPFRILAEIARVEDWRPQLDNLRNSLISCQFPNSLK